MSHDCSTWVWHTWLDLMMIPALSWIVVGLVIGYLIGRRRVSR